LELEEEEESEEESDELELELEEVELELLEHESDDHAKSCKIKGTEIWVSNSFCKLKTLLV
jgi:hypothetical protein